DLTADKIVLSTGRITSEVLVKASRSSFPIIVSRSSASSMAVMMAQQSAIDVVTYVRGGRFNYFSNGGVELINDMEQTT
ncbi:MAG: formate dehydrogenase accessory sulfurtransferase FdhD, partial [Desulfomonilaceae bacterium]